MNDIITWAAQHNTNVIQVIFSIILLLVLIYVYRLFFVNTASGAGDSSAELGEVNQKLDQLLEQQKSSGIQVIEKVVPQAEVATTTVAALGVDPATAGELDQAKAENAKLKVQLNELEKKVFELSPIVGAEDGPKADAATTAQITELNKKLEEMQARLSEYDIIADDIAELSQLRTENAELKKKVENGGGGGSDSGTAEIAAAPVATEAAPEETAAMPEPELQPEVVAAEAAPAVAGGVPGFDAETSALLESLVAETDAAAAAAEAPVDVKIEAAAEPVVENEPKLKMDQNISEDEKNLINEFEKSVQKGS